MNLGELRTLTARLCEDPNLSRFGAAKYDDAINKANTQFSLDSKALYKDYAITMVSGTAAYSLPSDFMLEKEVVLNGLGLKPISRATLQAKKTDDRWDNDEGTPRWYIIDPEEARKTITLYPKPNNTDDGTALVLTYYPVPATLTADADIPLNASSLMTQFHTALASYAAWMLMLYLPQTPEIAQKRSEFYNIYLDKIREAIQTFGNTKSESLSFAPVNVRVR